MGRRGSYTYQETILLQAEERGCSPDPSSPLYDQYVPGSLLASPLLSHTFLQQSQPLRRMAIHTTRQQSRGWQAGLVGVGAAAGLFVYKQNRAYHAAEKNTSNLRMLFEEYATSVNQGEKRIQRDDIRKMLGLEGGPALVGS